MYWSGLEMKIETKQARLARAGRSAFTLVEVIIAIMIIGFMAAVLYSGLTWGFLQTSLSRERLRATQVILSQFEILRAYTWQQLYPNSDPDELEDALDPFDPDIDPHTLDDDIPFTIPQTFTVPFVPGETNNGGFIYHGVIEIHPAPVTEAYSNSLIEVVVTVAWDSGKGPRSETRKTYFAEYGIQNTLTQ
jgi:prepilin-type N-terminal cleavage/methylation domain-containing protein